MSHQASEDAAAGGHDPVDPNGQGVRPDAGVPADFWARPASQPPHQEPAHPQSDLAQAATQGTAHEGTAHQQVAHQQAMAGQPSPAGFGQPVAPDGAVPPVYPTYQPAPQQFGIAPQGTPVVGSPALQGQPQPAGYAGGPSAQQAYAASGWGPAPGVDAYVQAQQGFLAGTPGVMPPVPASLGQAAPPENVARGVLHALGGVLVGVLLAVLVYRLGFIASLTTYVMALLILRLYAIGSGGRVRKGVVPVILLLVLGVVLTIMGYVGADAFRYYGAHAGGDVGMSRMSFVWQAMTTPSIYRDYGSDIALTILFAVLGVFSTIRSLVRPGRRRR